jgi:hypothetical protein
MSDIQIIKGQRDAAEASRGSYANDTEWRRIKSLRGKQLEEFAVRHASELIDIADAAILVMTNNGWSTAAAGFQGTPNLTLEDAAHALFDFTAK